VFLFTNAAVYLQAIRHYCTCSSLLSDECAQTVPCVSSSQLDCAFIAIAYSLSFRFCPALVQLQSGICNVYFRHTHKRCTPHHVLHELFSVQTFDSSEHALSCSVLCCSAVSRQSTEAERLVQGKGKPCKPERGTSSGESGAQLACFDYDLFASAQE
jgi:hypothetical protein